MDGATHRTICDCVVESRSGHDVHRFVVPAGTLGTIEYFGRVGGHHVVEFVGGGMRFNVMARFATPIVRIDWPREREQSALVDDLYLRAAA